MSEKNKSDEALDMKKNVSETEESTAKKPSTMTTINSIVGLCAIGIAVAYGLPHLKEATKSVVKGLKPEAANVTEKKKEDLELNTDDTAAASLIEKKAGLIESKVDQLSQDELNETVGQALIDTVWAEKRSKIVYVKSRFSKDKKQLKATYSFDENQFDILFTYDENFDVYAVKDMTSELNSLFSKAPSFSIKH